MKLPKPHVRVTAATLRKQDNFRKLIDGFRQGGMILADMCAVLGMSPSGGRKYLRELVAAEVLHITGAEGVHERFAGFPVWSLISVEAAEQFLAATKEVRPHNTPVRTKPVQQETPGVRVYMARDDTRFVVPRAVVVPRRDDLVSALFGPAEHREAA